MEDTELATILDVTSMGRLNAPGAIPSAGSLVVIEAPADDVAAAAGVMLANRAVSPEARPLDVRVASPAGDKWTVEELDEAVVGPSRLVPVERTVVVVTHAAAMDRRAAEHLLKTVEEPAGDCLYIFCVADSSKLMTTIRGRASASLHLDLAPAADRVGALVEAGVAEELAVEAVELAGPNATLAAALVVDDKAIVALRAVASAPLRVDDITTASVELAEALDRLGSATGWAASTPKAAARSAARLVISRWRSEQQHEICDITDAASFTRARAVLESLDRAEWELAGYAPVATVLAALRARVGPPMPSAML